MASSSRKKQDERNLKTLRELAALPQNKYCFDCNQRGTTYVDITIGSFVCTKCSGMLRGLTPPHRIKSISMATFTSEEIDLLRNRGNDYCKSVWLGLFDRVIPPGSSGDEQSIRDFMIEKYEKKRYYLDPAQALRNGFARPPSDPKIKPLASLVDDAKPIKLNGINGTEFNRKRPEANKNANFAVNFDNVDIFRANGNAPKAPAQESFANFDDNPVFSNMKENSSVPFTDNFNLAQANMNKTASAAAPSEDKYAALKDLDNALKTQNGADWNSSGSNGSLYSSPTPTGSMYSSPSPQSSMFGSPSQSQFMNNFLTSSQDNTFSNPFNNNGLSWRGNGNSFASAQANPFQEQTKVNGFQPAVFPAGGAPWGGANPFKVGATSNGNSNNPFLWGENRGAVEHNFTH